MNDNRCRYTRINGARCTMPALTNHDLCFQHQERRRSARHKPVLPESSTTYPLVSFRYMDDHAAILDNLNAITQAFSQNLIDHRQVGALTYLMQTCLKTLRQMKELEAEVRAEDAVRAVEYAEDGLPLAADAPAPLTLPTLTACAEPYLPATPEAPFRPQETGAPEAPHMFSNTYAQSSLQPPQNQILALLPGGRSPAVAPRFPSGTQKPPKIAGTHTKNRPLRHTFSHPAALPPQTLHTPRGYGIKAKSVPGSACAPHPNRMKNDIAVEPPRTWSALLRWEFRTGPSA